MDPASSFQGLTPSISEPKQQESITNVKKQGKVGVSNNRPKALLIGGVALTAFGFLGMALGASSLILPPISGGLILSCAIVAVIGISMLVVNGIRESRAKDRANIPPSENVPKTQPKLEVETESDPVEEVEVGVAIPQLFTEEDLGPKVKPRRAPLPTPVKLVEAYSIDIGNPEKFTKEVERLVDNGAYYKKSFAEISISDCVQVPLNLVNECRYDIRSVQNEDKKSVGKKINAHQNEKKFFMNVHPKNIVGSSLKWEAKALISGDEKMLSIPNAVTPTSIRSKDNKENHLANFQMQIDKDTKQLCITCAVIDTKVKADEFICGLIDALESCNFAGPPVALRLVSLQLNSQTIEKHLIEPQHELTRYIESELRERISPERHGVFIPEAPIVSHINLALDLASTLPERIEKNPAYSLSADGFAAQCLWLAEDIRSMEDPGVDSSKFSELVDEIASRSLKLSSCLESLRKKKSSSTDDHQLILQLQKELLSEITAMSESFGRLEVLFKSIPKPTAGQLMLLNKIRVLTLLNRKEVDGAPLLRNQEVELTLISTMMLKCVTQINCKSGLDRTGLARSMWDSLKVMNKQFREEFISRGEDSERAAALAFEKLVQLIVDQDRLNVELDLKQKKLAMESSLSNAKTLEDVSRETIDGFSIRSALIQTIKSAGTEEEQNRLLNALKYEDLIGANMLSVALPITLDSTGVAGLKYDHTDHYLSVGNPHPLKRLPMFIRTKEGKTIQLYRYQKGIMGAENLVFGAFQHRRVFTQAGRELVQRLSLLRGT